METFKLIPMTDFVLQFDKPAGYFEDLPLCKIGST